MKFAKYSDELLMSRINKKCIVYPVFTGSLDARKTLRRGMKYFNFIGYNIAYFKKRSYF